jgi:hypothetical protein
MGGSCSFVDIGGGLLTPLLKLSCHNCHKSHHAKGLIPYWISYGNKAEVNTTFQSVRYSVYDNIIFENVLAP